MARAQLGSWMGFLATAFAVVGLAGVFATYATPVTLQRLASREAALDAALATLGTPDQPARLTALAPALGEDATALAPGPGFAARVQQARKADRIRFAAQSAAVAGSLRLLIIVLTCAAGVFGLLVLSVVGRTG